MAQSFNCPAWALTIFFICWIIYYAIIYISKENKFKQFALCLIMVLIGIMLQINLYNLNIPLLNSTVSRGYISFFMGGIIYIIHSVLPDKYKKVNGYIHLVWIILLILAYKNGFSIEPFNITIPLCFFPSILFIVTEINVIKSILSISVFSFLGKISFSLYMCNFTFQIFTIIINQKFNLGIYFSSPYYFFGNIILQIGLAYIMYQIFEKKIPARLELLLYKK